jgi:hypothetical protein
MLNLVSSAEGAEGPPICRRQILTQLARGGSDLGVMLVVPDQQRHFGLIWFDLA